MNPETRTSFTPLVPIPEGLPSSPAELAIDRASDEDASPERPKGVEGSLIFRAQPDVTTPPRCQHRYPNGSRCRLRPSYSGLCSRHFLETRVTKAAAIPLPQPIDDSIDLSPDLLPELSESSAIDIRQFLARLLVQLTKGRVSARRAWVLSCISSQLLNGHRSGAKRM